MAPIDATIERLLDDTRLPLPPRLRQRIEDLGRSFGDAIEPRLEPGDRLGSWTIEEVLGAGGLGVVYRGRHVHLDRRAALKVPRPGVASRLLREGLIGSRLEHPAIVRIEGLEFEGDLPYLVMDLCPGGSLEDLLAEHPGGLPLAEVARLARPILDALEAAHAAGIVHLDVKPANILLDADGRPRLADFGIGRIGVARAVEDAGPDGTSTGPAETLLAGTPDYMPPEQEFGRLRRARGLDARADLYAFGVVLYRMLTGRGPGGVDTSDLRDRGVPDAVVALVARLVDLDPTRRPESAARARELLQRAFGLDESLLHWLTRLTLAGLFRPSQVRPVLGDFHRTRLLVAGPRWQFVRALGVGVFVFLMMHVDSPTALVPLLFVYVWATEHPPRRRAGRGER